MPTNTTSITSGTAYRGPDDPYTLTIPNRFLGGSVDVSEWMNTNLVSGITINVPNDAVIRWANRVTKSGVSNVTFRGRGQFVAHGEVNRAMLELTGGCTNWSFLGTRWDCNQRAQDDEYVAYQDYRNAALFCWGSANSNITLDGCEIDDIYTDGLYFYLGNGPITIKDCTFRMAAHRKQQAGNVMTLAQWATASVVITGNKFIADMPVDVGNAFDPQYGFGGVLLSAVANRTRGEITDNQFVFIGRNNDTAHRVAAIDFYDTCQNWQVTGNYIKSSWTAYRNSRGSDINFDYNTIESYGSPGDGPIVQCNTSILFGDTVGVSERCSHNYNKIRYVGPLALAGSPAIGLSCSHDSSALFDCEAIGNTIFDHATAFAVTGSVDTLRIHSNTVRGCPNGVLRNEFGGATGTASERRSNYVTIHGNKFLRNRTTGQGCTSGISWALPNPYTGVQTPLSIQDNEIECHARATSLGIVTFGSSVTLRGNSVDKSNIAFYTRGLAGNFVREGGNYATDTNTKEDFFLASVTREQPIENAASLKLDNLSPVAVFSTQRKLMSAYTGSAMQIRESVADGLADIGFSLSDETDLNQINAHVDGADGFVRTFYNQVGSNDLVQATNAAQLSAAASGAYRQVGGKFLPLGSSVTHMSGGSYTMTDFTFFVVARFSNSPQGVFNFGALANNARLTFEPIDANGGTLSNFRISNPATIACPTNKLVQITGYQSNALRRIWLNGVEGTPNSTPVTATISASPLFFSSLTDSIYRMAGYIGELIVIPGTVSETNRLVIEANLASYWSIV